MKRVFDLIMSIISFIIFMIPMVVISALIFVTSKGPILYWSDRVGKNGDIFNMPKFRTMKINTPEVASDLLLDPNAWYTPVGRLLRVTSLDELPQLWSVLIGDMSFVGPRPALHNQHELIRMRASYGVERIRPGITGWAQINGRDELSNYQKVMFDLDYLNKQSFMLDIKIIFLTIKSVVIKQGVSH